MELRVSFADEIEQDDLADPSLAAVETRASSKDISDLGYCFP